VNPDIQQGAATGALAIRIPAAQGRNAAAADPTRLGAMDVSEIARSLIERGLERPSVAEIVGYGQITPCSGSGVSQSNGISLARGQRFFAQDVAARGQSSADVLAMVHIGRRYDYDIKRGGGKHLCDITIYDTAEFQFGAVATVRLPCHSGGNITPQASQRFRMPNANRSKPDDANTNCVSSIVVQQIALRFGRSNIHQFLIHPPAD
jgi:hypothetical protein